MPLSCLAAFERHYLPARRLSLRTVTSTRSNLRRWARLSGDPSVDAIDEDVLNDFRRAAQAAGYRNDSIEGSVNCVLRVLRECARPKLCLVSHVPRPGIRLKVSTLPKYTPSLADLGKLYAAAWVAKWPTRFPAGPFWQGVFASALWTGLRRGDVFWAFEWPSIGEDSITVTAHKTGKVHVFPSSPVLLRHLEPLRGLHPTRVFPIGKCNHQILRELRRMAEAAGVRPFGLQAIRRRSCSNWQAAKWGAGEVVQGSAIRGSASRYIVPEILQQAAPRFQWPAEMLTAEERDESLRQERRLLEAVRRLGPDERAAVVSLAERLAT
jgi:integrase